MSVAAGSTAVAAEHQGGSGPPLLLLHGMTATFRIWAPVLPGLEAHHHVIAPTLAGHYGAPGLAPGVTASIESLTDRLEARLDELGIDRLHVAGNSLGGRLALELARRGRARTVVAFSPPAAWRSPRDLAAVTRLVLLGHLAAGWSGEHVRPLLARPRSRQLLLGVAVEHGERVPPGAAQEMLSENAGCAIVREFMKSVTGPMTEPLEPPDCPIRIAWPVKDRTVPFERFGEPLMELLPGGELVRLPGVGHVPMYDDPGLVVRTITEFAIPRDGFEDKE
ncbi:MAG TPA: alpha/beta hydrolase [Solirubrobacteraceae bacterium]|nr:alpha/beta hydrolase [Solirubrobacteraceae bacterium]